MLNSGEKIRALRHKKNKYLNSCVVRKTNSERSKPPFKLNGRSLVVIACPPVRSKILYLSLPRRLR